MFAPTAPSSSAPAPSASSAISSQPATIPATNIFSAPTTSTPTTAATTATTQPAATAASGNPGTGSGTSTNAPVPPDGSETRLGASTNGPAPPAQSRLKNKTMDEIITRWASDLTKYQKEFQNQAEKVSAWDRLLVENSEKIQKLYERALEAERATAEVEKLLAGVESQQDELSQWLDQYEREVDEMMARQVGQGDALQGPNQERERT
jgi:nuclear pore complex protein Nup62